MLGYDVLDDRQTQAGSSGRLGTALIDTIKTFKYTLLILFRNTDSRILNNQKRMSALLPHRHIYRSSAVIVSDRIVTQVVNQFFHQLFIRHDHRSFSGHLHRHILLLRIQSQHIHAFLRQRMQIQIDKLHLLPSPIKLGKLDDIIDQ